MKSHIARRILVIVGVGAVLGALTVALPAPHTGEAAHAAVGVCPPGSLPAPGNSNPIFTDNNVAVYAGGDYLIRAGAAEAEGLVIVAGDADFSKSPGGVFNVGWVGVGSGVTPSPGEVMLAVGGDLSVGAGTVLHVGANATENGQLLGGDVHVGRGTNPDYETDGSRYELFGGTLTQEMGAAAIAPWSTWGADIISSSAGYAGLATTGIAEVAGARLTLTGNGTALQQVFSVKGSELEGAGEIDFRGIPADPNATVIINVTGAAPIAWAPYWFSENGVRVDTFTSDRFGPVSERTLWNFTESDAVHVGGQSQVLGSIIVPGSNPVSTEPTLRVTASPNGRLYANGTILMDGAGNESHNYPFIDPPFDCVVDPEPVPVTGSLSITKVLSPEDAAWLPADTVFEGIVVCLGPGPEVTVADWEVKPGQTAIVDGLPVGATCRIIESIGPDGRPVLPPISGVPLVPGRFVWEEPVWNPDPTGIVIAGGTTPQIAFTVTNEIVRGAFVIQKSVTGVGAPTSTFSGRWACVLDTTAVGSGTWELAAGETSDPIEAPVGATCTVMETTPADPANGDWGAPVIDPASVLITAESSEAPLLITVANTFVETAPVDPLYPGDPVEPAAPMLPATGGTIDAVWLWTGAGLVAAGTGVLVFSMLRRRSPR